MVSRRRTRWDGLWLPATFVVFLAGAHVLPRSRSPWSNALLWATYGALWVSFIVGAGRLAARFRRRPQQSAAAAGAAREQPRAWHWAMWFTIYLVAAQLHPLVSDLSSAQVFVAAGSVIVVIELGFAALWRRADAARRRREVADLAREF